MYIKIQISDAVYASLLNGSSRIAGSIALISPNEGNFNAYQRARNKPKGRYMRLPHGRITVTDENIRMNLRISRDECVNVPKAIIGESVDACGFVQVVDGGCVPQNYQLSTINYQLKECSE